MVLKLLSFAGSLCFLLYGMKLMSDGIQRSAGQRLKSALSFMTGSRFTGLLTGCVLTMIIQSSGATTVMLVGFVNAGLVTLEQAVGVIFGANIGTTVTAWIVALVGFDFDLKTFAIPIFGLGYLLTLVKKLKRESLGIAVMGFGMLFIGLGWLSSAFKDPATGRTSEALISLVGALDEFGDASIVLAVVVGVLFTALIHSSSAMTAIVITIAAAEPSFWRIGAALVIGSTMGSTIDSIMASFGGSADARRTALIHVMFNCSASLIALVLFRPFLFLIESIIPGEINARNISYHIALLNTAFKVFATAIFIPFPAQIAALTRRLVKDRPKPGEFVYKFEFNEKTAHDMPETCVIQAQKEIADFADVVVEIFDELQAGIGRMDASFVADGFQKIERLEDLTDQMHVQLTHYLVRCSSLNISDESKQNVSQMMLISEEFESMADGCLSIGAQIKKAVEKEMPFRREDLDRLLPYFELSRQFLLFIYRNVSKIQRLSREQFDFASELEQQIDAERKSLKKVARKRLESGADVKAELLYLDIVRQIEKLGDRCFDMADELGKRGVAS